MGLKKNKDLWLSYIVLRRIIGILGLLLPLICIAGGALFGKYGAQRSISYYYHTNMRDFFVGLMFCVGMFMASYSGHDIRDFIASKIAGICGIGVGLFPCLFSESSTAKAGIFQLNPQASDTVHFIAAVGFFVTCAFISIFLFTLSDKPRQERKKNKKIRNAVYIICGCIMVACLIALLVLNIMLNKGIIKPTVLVLVFESIMLAAFGISWLVKGETLFKDPPDAETPAA